MPNYGVPEPTEEEIWEWERSEAAYEAATFGPDDHDPWAVLLERWNDA